MKSNGVICFILYSSLLYSGSGIQALTYDYSATTECLEVPLKVQYEGGIIQNPDFNYGIEGWTVFGEAKIEERVAGGNRFIVAFDRKHASDSFTPSVELENGKLYALSAWIQTSGGSATVSAVFRSPDGNLLHAGEVIAQAGCWSMLKGGIVANFSGPANLLFMSNNMETEIWADSISLQPFTKMQWISHQESTIAKVRKSKVRFQVHRDNLAAVSDAKISLKQIKPAFPFGCEINQNILNNTAYQNWFTSRFTVTAFGNEMKWYFIENIQGQEDYTIPDAMVQFAEQNNISIRGHNVVWDDPSYQPNWVPNLSREELQAAAERRTESVVTRYKGKVIAWDVVNENLHFSFFEDRLGVNASAAFYSQAHRLDQEAVMFMNEFNTIEVHQDKVASPPMYIKKLKNILSYPGNDGLPAGIGLQSRFDSNQPNLPYMRAGLDMLGAMNFPIWLTEVFVDKSQNQTQFLEEVLREGYAHPAVKGILIWPSSPFGQCKMCLTDVNFQNSPTGDVVDKLIAEWQTKPTDINVNSEGFYEASVFDGDYEVTITEGGKNSSTAVNMKVAKGNQENSVHVHVDGFGPRVSYI